MTQTIKVTKPAREVTDSGKVRIGGWAPSLLVRMAPANVADPRKVRIGGWSPAL